jgi:CRISPR-associated protein Cas4
MVNTLPQLTESIASQTSLRVSALHALAYCPRLFYLEEVEELYTQNAAVFAGRRLHLALEEQTEGEWEELFLESAEIGLKGKVDALRTRDGAVIPYEHKRGRSHRDEHNQPQAWASDKLQILAYTYLLELTLGIPIPEGRIRYHADNVLVRVPLDDEGKATVMTAISQARTLTNATKQIKVLIDRIDRVDSLESLLGFEGNIARIYFDSISLIQLENTPTELRFDRRNRRPPKDRFNALLGFGYALLLKDVMNAILTVGLEPALGFYHQPRTQASPLALDLMEIFRVPLVDMSIVNSINRHQWDIDADFEIRGVRVTKTNGKAPEINQVWLSNSGRRKFVEIYEQRKSETWKHPVIGYSLTYSRLLELEVRLLEKEWSGEAGLFGKLTLR